MSVTFDNTTAPTPGGRSPLDPQVRSQSVAPPRPARWHGVAGLSSRVLSVIALVVLLAFFAGIPVLQVLGFGYLLAASGRVARSGRLRDGAPGLSRMPGVIAVTLALLPWLVGVWLTRRLTRESLLIDPESSSRQLTQIAGQLVALAIGMHLISGLLRMPRARSCYQPVTNFAWLLGEVRSQSLLRTVYQRLAQAGETFQLPLLFKLGVSCYVTTIMWLAVPNWLLMDGPRHPVRAWIGGSMLTLVAMHLPVLQAQLATQPKWWIAFDLPRAWRSLACAPLRWLVAGALALLLPLPLYVLKFHAFPGDALWLVTPLVVVVLWFVRVVTGWAAYSGAHEGVTRSVTVVWLSRVPLLVVAGFYAVVVYYFQYLGWNGAAELWSQHAFLLPNVF